MKNTKLTQLTLILLVIAMVAAMFVFTGCQSEDDNTFTLGATQIVDHPALNACRQGAIDKLAELGYVEGENLTIDYQDSQGDPAVGSTIAQKFVSDKVDAILAISTPSAQSAYGAAQADGIPVVFSAVTDPVAAEIANADGSSLETMTGTSDQMPMDETFKLIKQLTPDAVTVGILHNTSEVNSDVLLALANEVAADYDMVVVDKGITSTNDISLVLDAILPEVDVMLTLTDNMVVSALPLILERANEAMVPVYGSEDSQVTRGSLASAGVDYYNLGLQTGAMIAKIFEGTPASEISIEVLQDAKVVINTETAELLGITIPDELLSDDTVEKVVTVEE